jgi:hypothetical protein
MKKVCIPLFLLLPIASQAVDYQGMNEADMQKMMQQMEQVQNCMEKVDREQLMALERRSRQIKAEIDSLCASGKRDQAQNKAIAFGKEVAQDDTMKTLRECGEIMQDKSPKLTFTGLDKDSSTQHICD